jgi:HD-GYP domain-containing protein (c-di-GMP phosphodiesterase class II)
LRKVVQLAARQHDIEVAEKAMLENTVRGSVTALAEVLAIAKPLAFGRVYRLRTVANAIGEELGGCDAWELDTAALLSQLGCICLPQSLLEKVAAGAQLTESERAEYWKHPVLGAELVRKVPRLENVATVILHQLKDYDGAGPPHDGLKGDEIPLAARILRVVIEHDSMRSAGACDEDSLKVLADRRNKFDQGVFKGLAAYVAHRVAEARLVPPPMLENGMIVEQDVVAQGVLLLCRGQEVTPAVKAHLEQFHLTGALPGPILVSGRIGGRRPST